MVGRCQRDRCVVGPAALAPWQSHGSQEQRGVAGRRVLLWSCGDLFAGTFGGALRGSVGSRVATREPFWEILSGSFRDKLAVVKLEFLHVFALVSQPEGE